VLDLSASETGPLQMVGTTTGSFTWSAWPDDWRQSADEPPGLAAEARAGSGARFWAEVQRADGCWVWSVERLDETSLRATMVASGASYSLLDALKTAGAAAEASTKGR